MEKRVKKKRETHMKEGIQDREIDRSLKIKRKKRRKKRSTKINKEKGKDLKVVKEVTPFKIKGELEIYCMSLILLYELQIKENIFLHNGNQFNNSQT